MKTKYYSYFYTSISRNILALIYVRVEGDTVHFRIQDDTIWGKSVLNTEAFFKFEPDMIPCSAREANRIHNFRK